MAVLSDPAVTVRTWVLRGGVAGEGARAIPEETAIAFVYDAGAEAVMMATPADLEDFAVGFSLTEGIVRAPGEIRELEIVPQAQGIELRIWLAAGRGRSLARRRRARAGPTGCGLCGVESLADALPSPPRVASALAVEAADILAGMAELAPRQELNLATRAVHAAALWVPGVGIIAVREDVGRHNALDKLAGALARAGRAAGAGVILITSRLSVELVQKAAAIGAPILAAVSAPTALALRTAEAAGITVIGVVRADGLEVFTHAERVSIAPPR
ncbi:MAG TPA: formate dehydrogenase accessory sulfurtransferase FdhD [Caulobacteraceae bacterium]|nr:formate dehydrogenase accessory sulfurtransferase FdhD [Caulobacteraceae bacterium]